MKNSKIIFGLVLVVFGLIFLVDQTGFLRGYGVNLWNLFWKLWPLILVYLGVRLLVQRNVTPGIILLIVGSLLLLSNIVSYSFWSLLWPLLIIGIGISILFKDDSKVEDRGEGFSKKEISKEDYISQTVIFFGWDKISKSNKFKGGEVNVAFGGVKLDLREIKLDPKGAKLHINCVFGGVEILAPTNCRVITNGTGIFGGWSPDVKKTDIETPTLEITGMAIFGGVEIK